MKKFFMMLLTVTTLSVGLASAVSENWHDKAIGIYCDHSICRCQIYYEDGSCYAIPDGTNQHCTIRRMSGSNTYNGYFKYDDCDYMVYIPYWPMN